MASSSEVSQCLGWFDDQLAKTVDFWMIHSIDLKHGGYYNCLGITGEVFDTTKHGWLQGRQVWMLSKLYNDLPQYHRTDILDAAVKGGDFLLSAIRVKGQNRCHFSVTEDGQPVSIQRKPYTECFFIMGLNELHKATQDHKYLEAAQEMLQQLIHWICVDDSGLGKLRLHGAQPTRELGWPMMLLNVLTEYCGDNHERRTQYSKQIKWSIENIQLHHDGQWVHEHILADGTGFPQGSLGRLTTPGHAIEAGWFLLKEADIRNDESLRQVAIEHFIEMPWSYGWDKNFGGFFYFLDTDGHSPIQLEWYSKLWWPHCEALIASLMAYRVTKNPQHWILFKQCFDYTVSHFADSVNGEWFGYLDRRGEVTHTFKGGPYKGFFHVPRCLMMCRQMLQGLASLQ